MAMITRPRLISSQRLWQNTPVAVFPRRASSCIRIQNTRSLHEQKSSTARAATIQTQPEYANTLPSTDSSNPALSFPCLDAVESRSVALSRRSLRGPEPSYTTGKHHTFHSRHPLLLDWGGILPEFDIAYETWGQLNENGSNAILLHTGLSASSHAHSTSSNPKPGWWEKFIGPDCPLDTNKYFIICTNVLGGCYGSTGPSSLDPADGKHYGTRFPILTMEDMVRAQFRLLDFMGIEKLYASVGSSMGGMQSLAAGVLKPERVGKLVSISGCARSHPFSIAMRHTQRQVLMTDPNWSRGFYYTTAVPPHSGMKLARQIATITYRSGPEWEQRFGRRRADPSQPPALCPDFLIETYLDHAGEKWCLEYDANSLLYVSKAMDLFDLGATHQRAMAQLRLENTSKLEQVAAGGRQGDAVGDLCNLTLPARPYEETDAASQDMSAPVENSGTAAVPSIDLDLVDGLFPLARSQIPTLVLGVASDGLFPAWQQREIADTLRAAGSQVTEHRELGMEKSLFGHDTFLLDLDGVGGSVKEFLG